MNITNCFRALTPGKMKARSRFGMAALIGAMLAAAGAAPAAVLTSLSSTAPSGADVLASQSGFSGGLGWYNTGAGVVRDIGQSFLATSSFTLDKITLALGGSFNSTTATSSFTLTLYSASNLATSPASATTVSTQTGTFAFTNGSGGTGTYLTFDIANVALTSGTYYTFMLSLNDPSASNSLTVRQNTSSTYSDGYRWLFDGTSYTSSTAGSDLTFYVQAAVPEPSAAVMALAGVGVLLLVRRKQA